MRKIVVGLMLLLPVLFVLAVFTSVKTVSLGIPVSVGGIEISERPENDTLRIDLSEYQNDYHLSAKVTPDGARYRDYFFKVDGDCVSVEGDGKILANKTGEARIIAVSKDGGFEDSIKAVVYATQPYDFSFSLSPLGREVNVEISSLGENYGARLETGRYRYRIRPLPEGTFSDAKIEVLDGFAEIDRDTLLLPFSGRTELKISLKSRLGGEEVFLEKILTLDLDKVNTQSGIAVNGGSSALVLEKESKEVSFFAEGEALSVPENENIVSSNLEELFPGKYRITLLFKESRDFDFFVSGAGGSENVSVSFSEFDFSVRSNLPVQTGERAEVLIGVPVLFYAVPSVAAKEINYEWHAENAELLIGNDSTECIFLAREGGDYVLSVRALRHGIPLDVYEKRLEIAAVTKVSAVQFALKTNLGLSGELVIGGKKFEGGEIVDNTPVPELISYDGNGNLVEAQMKLSTSDERIARIEDGKLVPTGTGKVTVTAEWMGNPSFGTNIKTEMKVYLVKDAVEIQKSSELFRLSGKNIPIVLKNDILLGTDDEGAPLPYSERETLLKRMKSTFNTEFYKSRGQEAEVLYVLEFCSDVYGNGHTLNAGLFSAEKDGTGQPRFFRGPLDFVSFGELASVSAQDNICFLARTDGVTLRNLTLLGCDDEVLRSEEGYDLSALDNVGTTLEINASVNVINCRVRNGRTVVRVYGGNRTGESYFTDTLESLGDRASRERIKVSIQGCIFSQGREFVLKIGANAALSSDESERSPALLNPEGAEYPLNGNELCRDAAFYEKYVFTDVTLKDSVLEKSGFFTVGMESNFSGELLQKGGQSSAINFEGWNGTGGTSFASVLRLEGDVRLYDWKELKLIDSSTLIKTELPELKLDIAAMLNFVAEKQPETYGEILDEGYVHGGIAFYGGGRNYSGLITDELSQERAAFREYLVNISVLEGAEGTTGYLGRILPSAAGTENFRFYLYGKSGTSSKAAQEREETEGKKYEGVKAFPCGE